MSETFKADFEKLFDRIVPFMTLHQMYCHAPLSVADYEHKHCRSCLPTELYLEICSSDQARRISNGSEEKRKRYLAQFKHEMFEHATFHTITGVIETCHRILEEAKSVAPKETSAENPLYQAAIDSICKYHVEKMEKCVEQMGKQGLTQCAYSVPAGPLREYLACYVDKASGGRFHITEKNEIEIKQIKGSGPL